MIYSIYSSAIELFPKELALLLIFLERPNEPKKPNSQGQVNVLSNLFLYVKELIFFWAQYREWTVGPLNLDLCVRACRITHVISIISISQLHFLANKNAELASRSQ